MDQQAALDFWFRNFLVQRYPNHKDAFDDGARRYTAAINLLHNEFRREYFENREEIEQCMKKGVAYVGRFVRIVPDTKE